MSRASSLLAAAAIAAAAFLSLSTAKVDSRETAKQSSCAATLCGFVIF